MTEAEIMKALECHKERKFDTCSNCPYFDISGCALELSGDALDLINRKNAENERLEKEYDRVFKENVWSRTEIERLKKLLDDECETCACGLIEQRDKAKAEAIKEFVERVMEGIAQENDTYTNCAKNMRSVDYQRGYEEKNDSIVSHIIHIAKEMGVEL